MKTRKFIRTNATASGVLSDDHAVPSSASGTTEEPSITSGATNKPHTASEVADDVTTSSAGKITDSLTTGYAATIPNVTNPESDPPSPLFTPKTTL